MRVRRIPWRLKRLAEQKCADGQNIMVDAIKALQYEGTKSEVAQGFKERGNEMVAEKKWKDAQEFYTKGIVVLLNKGEDKWDKPEDMEAEKKQCTALEEQLNVNRALCNLELSMLLAQCAKDLLTS
jgi:hypothetical protein